MLDCSSISPIKWIIDNTKTEPSIKDVADRGLALTLKGLGIYQIASRNKMIGGEYLYFMAEPAHGLYKLPNNDAFLDLD